MSGQKPNAPVRLPSFGLNLHGDDGHREAPRYDSLGDDSVPCRWWHPDLSPACARCGSYRMDLHDGEWMSEYRSDTRGGLPWSAGQRVRLGLPVAEQWWHDAAGWSVPSPSVSEPAP